MDELTLTERVAQPGDIVEVEDVYELTDAAAAYLASHSLTDAPADRHV